MYKNQIAFHLQFERRAAYTMLLSNYKWDDTTVLLPNQLGNTQMLSLVPWQNNFRKTSLCYQYGVIVVTVTYLWFRWYRQTVYAIFHQIFNDITNRNFRFSQTNIFSQVIYFSVLQKNKKYWPALQGGWIALEGILTHCLLADSSTVICWTSPFVILEMSDLFYHYYSVFDGKSF